MPWFEVILQRKDGKPARGIRVRMAASGLLGGMSKEAYTDDQGKAVIELASASSGTVYVDGRDRGVIRVGRSVITLP